VIVIAVLAPAASLIGAWWGVRFAGSRQLYADETARQAAFQESKRHSFSSLMGSLSTLRREPTKEAWAQYDLRREEALGYAKERRLHIIKLLGDDPIRPNFDLDRFRESLFDDPELR